MFGIVPSWIPDALHVAAQRFLAEPTTMHIKHPQEGVVEVWYQRDAKDAQGHPLWEVLGTYHRAAWERELEEVRQDPSQRCRYVEDIE